MWTALLDLATSSIHHLGDNNINVQPTTPPGSAKFLNLAGYASWFAMVAGIVGIIYGGGKFAWERMHGGAMESPKIIAGALIGGVFITTAGALMQAVVL